MTEEEYFRKNYPDSCYGDRLLSPYWDFFQDGVEFGERQSEKKIEELEEENKLLGERCNQLLKDKGNLTDELANWKEEWQEQVQKATDEGYARTLQTIQLTKAKEIIKILLQYDRGQTFANRRIYEKYMRTRGEAEQFLNSEVGKCQSQKQH